MIEKLAKTEIIPQGTNTSFERIYHDMPDIFRKPDSGVPPWERPPSESSGNIETKPFPPNIPPWETPHAPAYEKSEAAFSKKAEGIKEPEKVELSEKKGGSYGELKEAGYGWPDHEIHHMPADSASELPREDGPAIVMDYEDHRQTASCGNSKEAREYRQKQAELIEDGKFDEALQMDIDDIHEKFGDKYDDAIADMKQYAETLKEEGRA